MALVTHQMQGCNVIPSRHLLWSQGNTPKRFAIIQMAGRADACTLKKNLSSSVGGPCICLSKFKLLRISAFKGSGRNNASGSRLSRSKVQKNYVTFKDGNNSITETPKADDVPIYYTSDTNDGISTFPAFYKLFKKWLNLLSTQTPRREVDEILEEIEIPLKQDVSNIQHKAPNSRSDDILKSVWSRFLGLDAMIKMPIMIFIPLYLAVNSFYGAQVSKDLTPLWVMGPFIIAFYIKLFHWLCALYIFIFNQTTKIIKNIPNYWIVARSYIVNGQLKDEAYARFWQPIKNLDYSRRKLKVLGDWVVGKYMDYVESIWPFYCRTIRFLKRANLI